MVDLRRAHIGGQLNVSGAILNNPHGSALHGNRLVVDQDMLSSKKFVAHGEVHLLGARIGGQLSISGAILEAKMEADLAPASVTIVENREVNTEAAADHKVAEVEVEFRGLDVLDSIRLSLNQLTEYYTINKARARNSFRLSVFVIVTGLATIVFGIWLFYFRSSNMPLAAISTVAGVLVEFIGGAYFYLFNRATNQLNYFYGTLVRSQETMLAVFV